MIKITKVSPRRYEVFVTENDFTYMIFTIKRKTCDKVSRDGQRETKYIVRSMNDDVIIFETLADAKTFVRCEKTEEDVNWLSFFVRNTKGKKFENQKASNKHMKMLSTIWKNSFSI